MTACRRTDTQSRRVHLSARILAGSALALSLVLTACGGVGGITTPTAIVNQWTWVIELHYSSSRNEGLVSRRM